jgi:hypothetical protein
MCVSINREKGPLASSPRSLCQRPPTRMPLDGLPWDFYIGDFHGNLPRGSKNVSNHSNIWETLYEDLIRFYCCRRHEFAIKSIIVATLNIVILLTVVTSTIHRERTVLFPLQQWLSCYVVPTSPPLFQLVSANIYSIFLQQLAFLPCCLPSIVS